MQDINILDLETVSGGAAASAPVEPAPSAPVKVPPSFCKYLAAEGSRLIRNKYKEKGNHVLELAGKCWNWNRTPSSAYEED